MKEKGILYLIADRKLGDEKILEALAAGLDMIQLREKNLSSAEYLRDAKWLCEKAHEAGALFLVNDRLDIALACGAWSGSGCQNSVQHVRNVISCFQTNDIAKPHYIKKCHDLFTITSHFQPPFRNLVTPMLFRWSLAYRAIVPSSLIRL